MSVMCFNYKDEEALWQYKQDQYMQKLVIHTDTTCKGRALTSLTMIIVIIIIINQQTLIMGTAYKN